MHTLDVVIRGVIGIQHTSCNIRNVLASITFTSDVNLVSFHAKGINEILPETHELRSNVMLVVDSDISGRESGAHRLIDIDHVGEIDPAVGVGHWGVGTWLP